jgi:hypothetical protein
MAARRVDRRQHILLEGTAKAEAFTSPYGGGGKLATIPLNRARHGAGLRRQLAAVERELARRRGSAVPAGIEAPKGFYLEFESPPGFDLKFESLESATSGIELMSVRRVGDRQRAIVFVPEGKITYFITRVEKYLTENTAPSKNAPRGNPKNQQLVESVAEIRLAIAESFWTDDLDLLPERGTSSWWEVWLRGEGEPVLQRFRKHAEAMDLDLSERHLVFPERTVVLAQGTLEKFADSLEFLDMLAELRAPREIGGFFMRIVPREQAAWASDLARRTTWPADDAVAVCILDTGINRGHPLLENVLAERDMQACDPNWGKDDHDGHGTEMAGIATYGDLRRALASAGPVTLRHRLESAKILPPPPGANRKELYGAITADGISRVEIDAPVRLRVISMAITSIEDVDRGQPSSWSAEVDKLCVGSDEERRLFFVSAGNLSENAGLDYRDRNETVSIHDPAQAWNALTVGAYTELTEFDEPSHVGWTPVAPAGDLSPSTTTSCVWQGQWPIKPDIVMEGGNMVLSPDRREADFTDSLSVLSTFYQPLVRLFCSSGDTSAATAAAARLGAIVRAYYPERWPETIRALIVDSAEWTQRMREQLVAARDARGVGHLVRCFGFGVPRLARALWSAGNALTLIAESEMQPFAGDKSNEMHLHRLPWPRAQLLSLGDAPVELRVTLSYFIEPNPARRGWKKRHRYASHGLRFSMQKPTESIANFRKRVNKQARDPDEEDVDTGEADQWVVKPGLRGKGSVHHDRWLGIAADLATCEHIAVYPVIGWWRERLALGKSDSRARYSLVVSIRTPETTVDLYQAVQIRIASAVRT